MTKNVKLKDGTHKRLKILQAEQELKSIDNAIQHLFEHQV